MSSQLGVYRRVASLYKWDYQKAEMALAEEMARLNHLRRSCHRLDASLDALLDGGEPERVDADAREGMLRLAGELSGRLDSLRAAYDAQVLQVLDCRRRLLMARARRDRSAEKRDAARAAWQRARVEREAAELADIHVARRVRRSTTANVEGA